MTDVPLLGEHQSINAVDSVVHLFNRYVRNNPLNEFLSKEGPHKWGLPVLEKSRFTVNINPLDEGPTHWGISGEMKGTSFHCSQSHSPVVSNHITKEHF